MPVTLLSQTFDDIYRQLKEASVSTRNLEVLKKYDRTMTLSVQESTRRGRLMHLRQILLFAMDCERDIPDMTEDDILDMLQKFETYEYDLIAGGRAKYSDAYKNALRISFRVLLKSCDNENYKDIKTKKQTGIKLPEELLTKDEVLEMVNVAQNPRDKAYIMALYETGSRISELLEMKIKNVSFDEYGAVLMLARGKTGMRRVRVVNSSMLLQQWIESHPRKDESDAPLWCTVQKSNGKYGMMGYSAAKSVLRIAAQRAGIKKKVNPHSFRHARATHLAETLTEQQMKSYLGWAQASKMAATYVHLSGKDVDNAILRLNGIDIDNDPIDTMKPNQCPRCQKMCPPKSAFCGNCGLPMNEDAKAAYAHKMDDVMDTVLSVPKNEPMKKYITKMREK